MNIITMWEKQIYSIYHLLHQMIEIHYVLWILSSSLFPHHFLFVWFRAPIICLFGLFIYIFAGRGFGASKQPANAHPESRSDTSLWLLALPKSTASVLPSSQHGRISTTIIPSSSSSCCCPKHRAALCSFFILNLLSFSPKQSIHLHTWLIS